MAKELFAGIVVSVGRHRSDASYDLETFDKFVEIKSCTTTNRGSIYRKKGQKNHYYKQSGRFFIYVRSHRRLLDKAVAANKTAEYIFTIRETNSPVKIVERKILSWTDVETLISKSKVYEKRDGSRFVQIPNSKIFG